MSFPRRSKIIGFTLLEMLVVIAILAILIALALPAIQGARAKADLAGGVANMRQWGVAMTLYAADNNQSLPGEPLLWGQWPIWNRAVPSSLGTRMITYFGIEPPNTGGDHLVKAMAPPLYWRMNPGSSLKFPMFIRNTGENLNGILLADGTRAWPWGRQGTPNIPPMTLPAIASAPGLMRTWMLRDVDQTGPFPNNQAGWGNGLPKSPLYGKSRLQLNFDMSAEVVSSSLNMTQNR